jgi:hypothetical protein
MIYDLIHNLQDLNISLKTDGESLKNLLRVTFC